MKSHVGMVVLVFLVIAVLLVSTVAYTVDFTEQALIKRFGATLYVLKGPGDAGLHFKWPWPVEQLVKYDGRTFVFEDTSTEVETRDKQNLLVTTYCAWRIEDARQFHKSVVKTKTAQDTLRGLLRSAKGKVVGQHDMEAFVNTDPQRMLVPLIERQVMEEIAPQATNLYGVRIVSVGIKSLALPENVTGAVIGAMKEERQREVRRYEAAGEAQATAIRERARTANKQILEFAQRKAAAIRAEGVRQAAQSYESFRDNESFSMFLRSLESLETELASRAVILLDASQVPALNWFHSPPSLPQTAPGGETPAKTSKAP